MKKRGLCSECSSVFEYQLSKLLTRKAKLKYEADLMSEGKLLAPQEIRTLKCASNPLVLLARKVASNS